MCVQTEKTKAKIPDASVSGGFTRENAACRDIISQEKNEEKKNKRFIRVQAAGGRQVQVDARARRQGARLRQSAG